MNPTQTDSSMRVFISYRRSDCQPQANGLHDGLSHRLRGASIFMDIDSIPYGVDFEQHIRQEIAACQVVLVLIGDNWLDTDAEGLRRLDQDEDFVRLEIENALATPSVLVIPVLVEGAKMPSPSQLPASIARLARLNAIELSDQRWKADLERLAGVVEEVTAAPVQLPPVTEPMRTLQPSTVVPHLISSSPSKREWRSRPGLMIALPLISFGFLAWLPPLLLLKKLTGQARSRARLVMWTCLALLTVAVCLFAAAPQDATGSSTGPLTDIGTAMILVTMLLATVLAVRHRECFASDRPEIGEERVALERRRSRDHYRALAAKDPAVARDMRIGRPDLARQLDDGGLIDLNGAPVELIVRECRLSRQEALAIVEARERFGALSGVDELVVHAGLSTQDADRLRDVAVFL